MVRQGDRPRAPDGEDLRRAGGEHEPEGDLALSVERRVVVLGGTGLFGGEVAALLRTDGIEPAVLSRRAGADAERPDWLRANDVVVDAAGPFHARSTALVDAACRVGADIVDLNDSRPYAERVIARAEAIAEAGIRVLSSCSAVSAISASLVRLSGVAEPSAARVFLAPATRYASYGAAVESYFLSRGGARKAPLREVTMPPPVGRVRGHRIESADEVLLPRVWPSLREVGFYVAPRAPVVRWLAPLARVFGHRDGGFAVEVDGVVRALAASERAHRLGALPAAMAAYDLATGRFDGYGLIPADAMVRPEELVAQAQARLDAVFA